MTKVLLISDNLMFSSDLAAQIQLSIEGYEVSDEYNPSSTYDIVIIDEKADLLENVHNDQVKAPVFLLTAQETLSRPYLTIIEKPFSLDSFIDNLRSCMNIFDNTEIAYVRINHFELRPNVKEIINLETDEIIKLTEKEVHILKYLYKAGTNITTKKALLKEVWGYNVDATTHTIETHIYRLRQKIEHDNPANQIIITEDKGYRLKF